MEGFTLAEMIKRGWPVLTILFGFSIISVTVIVDRMQLLRRTRTDARGFVRKLLDLFDRRGREGALAYCEQLNLPFARVMADVLRQKGDREHYERALVRAIRTVAHQLEHRIPVLGTIAGTAPFVGLLGTVIGIMRAFRDIAEASSGGPEVVSAGIAEALVTTAFGLAVAIPAVMFYNFLVSSVRRLSDEWEVAGSYLVDTLANEDATP